MPSTIGKGLPSGVNGWILFESGSSALNSGEEAEEVEVEPEEAPKDQVFRC